VDILLLAEAGKIDANRLSRAIQATFDARKTHLLPREIPDPPTDWVKPFQKLSTEVSLSYQTLDAATIAVKHFLNPLLSEKIIHKWDPGAWYWS
jgi:hypothetical protein